MSGSFAGPRPGLTASVFTTRKLSALSSNTLMRMLRGACFVGKFVGNREASKLSISKLLE